MNMLIYLAFENTATSSSSSLVVFVFDCKKILIWSQNLGSTGRCLRDANTRVRTWKMFLGRSWRRVRRHLRIPRLNASLPGSKTCTCLTVSHMSHRTSNTCLTLSHISTYQQLATRESPDGRIPS